MEGVQYAKAPPNLEEGCPETEWAVTDLIIVDNTLIRERQESSLRKHRFGVILQSFRFVEIGVTDNQNYHHY